MLMNQAEAEKKECRVGGYFVVPVRTRSVNSSLAGASSGGGMGGMGGMGGAGPEADYEWPRCVGERCAHWQWVVGPSDSGDSRGMESSTNMPKYQRGACGLARRVDG